MSLLQSLPSAVLAGSLLLGVKVARADGAVSAVPSVASVWSRPALQGRTGVMYFTVEGGAQDDRLLHVDTPVAAAAELHLTVEDHGVMRMRPAEPLAVPAGGTVRLEPGRLHVMLLGLTRDLAVGDPVPVVLTFSKAGKIQATGIVLKRGRDPGAMDGMTMAPGQRSSR